MSICSYVNDIYAWKCGRYGWRHGRSEHGPGGANVVRASAKSILDDTAAQLESTPKQIADHEGRLEGAASHLQSVQTALEVSYSADSRCAIPSVGFAKMVPRLLGEHSLEIELRLDGAEHEVGIVQA